MANVQYVQHMRDLIGPDLLLAIGVSALIRNENGEILITQRADDGRWVEPGGGLEPGESPAQAVIREVREETGLDVEVVRLIGVYGGPNYRVTGPGGAQTSIVGMVFDCRITGGTPQPDGVETTALKYVAPQIVYKNLGLPADVAPFAAEIINTPGPAFFEPPTWAPTPGAPRKNGISDYAKGLRAKIGQACILSPGAAALIFDEQGRILLQRRGDTGTWGMIGGGIDPDESPANAVVREVWEETGLHVTPERLVSVFGGPDHVFTYPNGDQAAVISFTFACKVVDGIPTPDGVESLELAWFDPAEALTTLDMPERMARRITTALKPPTTTYFE